MISFWLLPQVFSTILSVSFFCRFEFRVGQCTGAHPVPDRVLQRWVLRAHRVREGADHAEGVRLQVPPRAGDQGRAQDSDRQGARVQERAQAGSHFLQEEW